jgi:hypothetical protein
MEPVQILGTDVLPSPQLAAPDVEISAAREDPIVVE